MQTDDDLLKAVELLHKAFANPRSPRKAVRRQLDKAINERVKHEVELRLTIQRLKFMIQCLEESELSYED